MRRTAAARVVPILRSNPTRERHPMLRIPTIASYEESLDVRRALFGLPLKRARAEGPSELEREREREKAPPGVREGRWGSACRSELLRFIDFSHKGAMFRIPRKYVFIKILSSRRHY